MAVGAINITRDFVREWLQIYYDRARDEDRYQALIREVAILLEPKYLSKDLFVRIAVWKSDRPVRNYEDNDETLVREATRLAWEASNEVLKLHILQVLKGVRSPVASAILHFFYPDRFAIFDVRVRTSLARAGKWGSPGDDSSEAWRQYVHILRDLSTDLGMSLREVEIALWACDKWDP